MTPHWRGAWISGLVLSGFVWLTAAALAQSGPVAAMFNDDKRRAPSLAISFERTELPPAGAAGSPLQIYLSAGDLARAFDTAKFRPDAAIVPTNDQLQIDAPTPATQRVLIDRVRKRSDVLRTLEQQIAGHRQQPRSTTSAEPGLLRIGMDSFVADLSSPAARGDRPFPRLACLIATDFAAGGAVDQRELLYQDRVRTGIAACLEALDAKAATSVVLPLMGASTGKIQKNDPGYEGQRALKECRLLNSTAGIALGIHDFAASRRNLQEIGVIQWDQEIAEMFDAPKGSPSARTAQMAYSVYAGQIQQAFRKGLTGAKTVPSDVNGNCSQVLGGR